MKSSMLLKSGSGFTLIELIISMAVFIVIMIIAGETFKTIATQSSKLTKMEESNIEGIVGLEVMRHDLEQMGFGLPWAFHGSINYSESTEADPVTNDAPGIPRAFVGLDGFANFSSDFIAIKASSVGNTKTSQRWTYIPFHNFSTTSGRESRPVSFPSNNLIPTTDKVIALRTSFNNMSTSVPVSRQPVQQLMNSSGSFSFPYKNNGTIADDFLPKSDQDTHYIYGIETDLPRMPFNRADFFIKVPTTEGSLPPFCAPRTGILYKKSVRNTGTDSEGEYTPSIPLLDCVADMQVVLGWSSNSGTGRLQDSINAYSSLPLKSNGTVAVTGSPIADDIKSWLQDAQLVREHLKMVKVYILAQEGKRDANYTYPSASIKMFDELNGETTLSRTYTFTEEQRHYRWKLYRIFVKPKNLVSNQR